MILACATCDSRYDVTGHAPGEHVQCRCGATLTVKAPAPAAGELMCPHCGGGVSPTASTCSYCRAELLVKACPRCTASALAGDTFCRRCGAELQLAASGQLTQELPCPRCDAALRARLVGDVLIDECAKCGGVFLDHVAVQRVIEDRQHARAEALLGELPRRELRAVPVGSRMYVKCPLCHVVMNRRLFASGTGIIVDVCRTHGSFFDAGELPAAVDFVMKGGLEAAHRKDIERQREELARAKAAAAAAPIMASTPSDGGRGHALSDLLFSLFGL